MTLQIFVLLRKQKVVAWIAVIVWIAYVLTSPMLPMLFLDSGVSLFLISTITLAKEFESKGSRTYIYLAAIAAGLCALSKIYGLSAIFFLISFVIYDRFSKSQRKQPTHLSPADNFLSLSLSIIIALSWFLYGFLVAPDLFLKLLTENAQRSILSPHNINLLVFVTNPVVSYSQILVGRISVPSVIGLIGLLYIFLRKIFAWCN
jgi:hypothetical protein